MGLVSRISAAAVAVLGTSLLVACGGSVADADSDVGQVAYEMTLMVKRVGVHLGTAPRSGPSAGG